MHNARFQIQNSFHQASALQLLVFQQLDECGCNSSQLLFKIRFTHCALRNSFTVHHETHSKQLGNKLYVLSLMSSLQRIFMLFLCQVHSVKACKGRLNCPPACPHASLQEVLNTFWSNLVRQLIGGLAKTCLVILIFVRLSQPKKKFASKFIHFSWKTIPQAQRCKRV